MGHVYDLLKFSLKQEGRDDIVWKIAKNFYNNHCLVTIVLVIILSYLIVQIQRLSFYNDPIFRADTIGNNII